MTDIDIIVLGGATFVASFIKGGAGMGAGLFLQPTLTLIFDPFTALALCSPILLFSDSAGILFYWRQWVHARQLVLLLAGCVLGAGLGVLTVPFVTPEIMKVVVGLCGLVFVASKVITFKKTTPTSSASPILLFVVCVLGGFFNSVANAGGIFFAYCCLRMNLPPRTFVSTVVIVVLTTSILKVPGYVAIGLLSMEQLMYCLPLLPVVILGGLLGSYVNKHLNPRVFRTLVLIIIGIMSGSTLLSLV